MATYNRATGPVRVLNESIYSFVTQTYPRRELIIVNDTPGQKISLDYHYPRIKIINTDDRAPTLGDKMNMVAEHAQGDYLAIWDDDDICLPWRLQMSLELLNNKDYVNVRGTWQLDSAGQLAYNSNLVVFPACLFSRKLFDDLNHYPAVPSGQDYFFYLKVPPERASGDIQLRQPQAFYIYRWDMRLQHLSHPDEGSYARRGTEQIETGHFQISPAWDRDYPALTRTNDPTLASGQPQ
jgi:glycosyltransferase involved in cell wall biosynthesis